MIKTYYGFESVLTYNEIVPCKTHYVSCKIYIQPQKSEEKLVCLILTENDKNLYNSNDYYIIKVCRNYKNYYYYIYILTFSDAEKALREINNNLKK